MKKILLFSVVIIMLLATSCAEKEAFTIKGTLPSSEQDGQQVYLQGLDSDWKTVVGIDTATVTNGTFEFKGLAKDGAVLRIVALATPNPKIANKRFVVEPGNIQIVMDSLSTVKGTPINDNYQAFSDKMKDIEKEGNDLYAKMQAEPEDEELKKETETKLNDIQKQITNLVYDYSKANAQNPLGEFMFMSSSYLFSTDQLKEILALTKPEFKANEKVQKLEKRIQVLDLTAEGKNFTDIKGKTPGGKDIALSDYAGKGKYILVDFWASWCGPCIREMPNVIEIYGKYKNKGFEIVGVSLDKENAAWQESIKKLNITWPQISDLKGWDSELSGAYGIVSIPHMMLLDKDGKIIARGISSKDLSSKLEELLGK